MGGNLRPRGEPRDLSCADAPPTSTLASLEEGVASPGLVRQKPFQRMVFFVYGRVA